MAGGMDVPVRLGDDQGRASKFDESTRGRYRRQGTSQLEEGAATDESQLLEYVDASAFQDLGNVMNDVVRS